VLAGYFIDKWRRSDWMLQIGGYVGLAAAAALVFTLSANESSFAGQQRFVLISVGMGAFGSYQGIWNTALETIFADSAPTGRLREHANKQKFMLTLVSTCSGPLLANLYFYSYGSDDWSEVALRDVFIIGIVLCVPPMFLLCLFRDEDTLGASADAVDMRAATLPVEGGVVGGIQPPKSTSDGYDPSQKYILHIVALNDLIGGLGSGMSIKFFPLYFKSRGLSPSNVNWIYVTSPIVMALGSILATRYSKKYGRVRVAMCFGCVGSAGMVALGVLNLPADSNTLCIALFFVSCAQHCCRPIKKSLLMDFCARENRGFWNAVDSVTRFGWSGSAVLGGFLVDRYDYGATFLATGVMLFAAASLWPLLFATLDALDAKNAAATDAKQTLESSTNGPGNSVYLPLYGGDFDELQKEAMV
jgi:MFS family permease